MDYKRKIIEMIEKMENEEYLKKIYYYILYPYELEKRKGRD